MLRGLGYRGPRPALVGTGLVLLVLGADLAAAVWLRSAVAGAADGVPIPTGLLGAAAMNLVFFMAGPALLLTESIRHRGSRLHMVLGALPLTLREISVVTWLPSFAAAVFLVVLFGVPASALLTGVGMSPGPAVRAVVAASLAGVGLAALVIVVGRWLMRGSKWAGAQFPTMLLLWALLCAVQTWQVGRTIESGTLAPWGVGLLMPVLADEMNDQQDIGVATLVWFGAIAAGLVALVPWSARVAAGARLPSVLWQWRAAWSFPLTTLEFTRHARTGVVVVNVVAAQVVVAAVAAATLRLEGRLQAALVPYVVGAIVNLNAIPLLLIRGQTRSPRPVPLVLGWSPLRWVGAQACAGLAVFLATAVIPLALLISGEPSTWQIVGAAVPSGVFAFGLVMAIGWAMPASPENPLGQMGGTLINLTLFAVIFSAAAVWWTAGSLVWATALVVVGLTGLVVPVIVERTRWRRLVPAPS
jgi:hypothetical protein